MYYHDKNKPHRQDRSDYTIANIMVDVVVLARNVQAGNPQLEIKTDPVSKLTIDIIEQSIDKKFFS